MKGGDGHSSHRVGEGADVFDGDVDDVAGVEGEGVGGDDACAGHEEGAGGEGVVAVEEAGEFGGGALELGEGGFAFENGGAGAGDLAGDGGLWREGFFAEEDGGAEGGATGEALGLGEVEGVLAFDVAAREVVAAGDADDFATAVDGESEFGLGHHPGGVGAEVHGGVGADGALGGGFEEDFGALGLIDAVVEGAAAGVFAFFHAGGAAAEVGDTCGPDFLGADGGEEVGGWGNGCGGEGGGDTGIEIGRIEEFVPIRGGDSVVSAVVLDEDAGGGAVEEHGGRCKTAGGLDARIEVLCSWFGGLWKGEWALC